MILLRNSGRRAIEGKFYVFHAWAIVLFLLSHPIATNAHIVPEHHKLLKDIHDEVVHFGINKDPDLIKREFWMDLDGQEDNKEEHVVVMRYSDGMNLRMTVQVTYFSEDKGKRFVRFAKDTKLVQCCINEHDLEINRSDYSDKEMEKLFNNILIAIRNKKELLKLIKH
ncbi:MAG: hypothetical protein JSV17_13360 [Candidatus Aminicenantes bacterium]|nr:MAG: hypothetical protein JSV17_13360 [Candidatus Aminicenantes bacterium]